MPASVAPMPGRLPVRGFSLLELLVVVFIIGILATMFTLSVGILGEDSEIGEEADRLQALLKLAREDAVMEGREYGLHFYPDGYEFSVYEEDFIEYFNDDDEARDQSGWVVLQNSDTLLKPRRLPEDVVIEVEIDGREIVLKEKKKPAMAQPEDNPEQTGAEPYRPQIWIYSSGDMSPFVIRFRRKFENDSQILEFSEDGTVKSSRG